MQLWDTAPIIESCKQSGHRLFVIGVGNSPSSNLLQELALQTGGACELVSPNEDMSRAITRTFHRLMMSASGKLALQWNSTPL